MRRFGADERRARLLVRHRLTQQTRAGEPTETAHSLVALHSTDAATVYLSTWARTRDFEPSQLERTLYEERTLVRMLGMRRTLWVVPDELAPVVHAACTRAVAARERRRLEQLVAQSGVVDDPAGWLERVASAALDALAALGEAFTSDLTRADPLLATKLRLGIGSRWEAEVSVASRILPLLAAEGAIVRGRPRGGWTHGQYCWALAPDAHGDADTAAAQAELLHRWLHAFGPATETDIRWWTGWTAREARAALAATPHHVVELDGSTGYVLADDLEPVEPPPPSAALLPTLDPTTMGWKEREWYLGPHADVLFDRNGNAGPTAWWDGRVVGGWAQRADGEIAYRVLENVGREAVRAIEAEASRLAAWLGDVRVAPGFLPPFQRGLAS
ncbi:MAG: winged helix DNA-binding domain-containing protein [Gaiella sp.]|nr:winged helix DNA-binding domain-containing protein [Gaiella sp.]